MKKIKLFDRSEEIFNKLPKNYAEIILNAVIARSASNGSLFNEVELYLTSDQFNEFKKQFKDKNQHRVVPKEVIERKPVEKYVEKKRSKTEVKKEEAVKAFSF